jgi:hypothetical protein
MTSLVLCHVCSTAEKIMYIFLQDLSQRKYCLCGRPADFSYDKLLRTLHLMHDGRFDKILPKQVGNFRRELTENSLRKSRIRSQRHVAVWFSLAGSSLHIGQNYEYECNLKWSFPQFSETAWSDHMIAVWPIKCLGLLLKHPILFSVEIREHISLKWKLIDHVDQMDH